MRIVLAILATGCTLAETPAYAQRGCAQKEAVSWEATIAGPTEPGDRMIVEGIVTGSDGQAVAGAVVYAYHTDARGIYGPDSDTARLCGLALTGTDGRYRFHTVRPASYPNSRIPAHVHYVVSGESITKAEFLLEFEGDPFLAEGAIERDRREHEGLAATYRGIRPIEKHSGVWSCRRDLSLATDPKK